jgi:hypothetical protein
MSKVTLTAPPSTESIAIETVTLDADDPRLAQYKAEGWVEAAVEVQTDE